MEKGVRDMSNGEKILSGIRQECDEKIAAVNAETESACQEILDTAKKQADEIIKNARYQLEEQSAKLLKAHQSRSELEKRNMLLKTRRTEIDKAVDAVLQYMVKLPDKVYFELIYKLAKNVSEKNGIIYLNGKDLKRVPNNFESRLAELGITAAISKTPNDSIESGFILKNGDIEENMSFSSIISERREEIEDLISKELFK